MDKAKYRKTMTVLASLLIIVFGSSSGFANNTASDRKYPLTGQWLFHDGFEKDWLKPDYQAMVSHSEWQKVAVPQLLGQAHNRSEYGSYRLDFFVDPAYIDYNQAIYIDSIRNGDISYLNGQEIGRTGSLENAWSFNARNPESLARVYPIPKDLLKPGNNVLVIKINTGFGNAWGALYPGGAGISSTPILLGDRAELQDMAHQKSLETAAFDMVFITLGLLDLLIIGILLKRAVHHIPEFRWLLWGSILMMLGTVSHDVFYLINPNLQGLNFIMFSSMMLLPLVNALYFWSQNKNLPLRLIQFVFTLWVLSYAAIILPGPADTIKVIAWYTISILLFVSFSYALYCAYIGIRCQRVGAIAQAIGLVVYILSIRSQWLPDIFLEHRNIQIGSLIFRYALLFAYFQKIEDMKISFQQLSQKIFAISDATRSDIARELHDGLGQNLSSAKLQLQLAQSKHDPKHLEKLGDELNHAVSGMRRLINGLHISLVDQMGFYPAIKQEIQKLASEHEVTVAFDLQELELSEKIQQNLYRIIQECSRNAIRHGQASEISIRLKDKGDIELSIADNGIGFDPLTVKSQSTEQGFGMVSLKERVNLLNGNLDIRQLETGGSHIAVKLPKA